MTETQLTYQDLFNEMDRIKKRIYDECGTVDYEISEIDYDADLYDMLLKLKEFESGIERGYLYDKYSVLSLKNEIMLMVLMQKDQLDNSMKNIIKIDIDSFSDENKKKLASELENLQMMFSNGFFMVAALRNLFVLKKDIKKIESGCSELTNYFKDVERRKEIKECVICLNDLADYIRSYKVQVKLVSAIKILFPHLADNEIELYVSRRDDIKRADLIMRVLDEHHSVVIGSINTYYFNLIYNDEFKDDGEEIMIRNAIFSDGTGMLRYDIHNLIDDHENTKKKTYVDNMIKMILKARKNIDEKIKQYGQ